MWSKGFPRRSRRGNFLSSAWKFFVQFPGKWCMMYLLKIRGGKRMNTCYIPQGYRTPLTGYDMQRAIEFVKSSFQENLK